MVPEAFYYFADCINRKESNNLGLLIRDFAHEYLWVGGFTCEMHSENKLILKLKSLKLINSVLFLTNFEECTQSPSLSHRRSEQHKVILLGLQS